ncbi:HlyD family secretion protein [Shewanella surugensis]|uniref:HlyD family secretion protein n=1 Tax=Shewanella surugensis TaxID=212020 RepID=A0ABT0L6C3_9GAMM|nr:HlyD family secretion protein [Shewanella surugensis]MCL1123241.1 HlyD family secretion protein [Shewanella surugensis]
MKKYIKQISLLLILGVLVTGFGYWFSYGRHFQTTDNAYVTNDITKLSARTTGVVVESYIHDNQPVKKGQLLVVLDNRDQLVTLQKMQANVAQVSSEIDNAKAESQMQISKVAEFQSQTKLDLANKGYTKQQYQRYLKLLKKNFVAQGDVDNEKLKYTQADIQYKKDSESLKTQQDQLTVLASKVKQSQASLAEVQANLEQAKLDLSYTRIVSPIDGIISDRSEQVGTMVQSGQTIASIVSARPVWIVANFKETQRSQMKIGQPVDIHLDAYSDRDFQGKVSSVSPATGSTFALLPLDNATGNFTKVVQRLPVRIAFDQPEHLASGLSATVTVDTRH